MRINNRRYIGNKFKLLPFISGILDSEQIKFNSIADIFAGTGVVSEYFLGNQKYVIINDILYSNFIFYTAWLSNEYYNPKLITEILNYYNNSDDYLTDNYFSDTFSNTYYHYEDAKKIGSIREHLESIKSLLLNREYAIILTSLLYSADKIANSVGHFESYLQKQPIAKGVYLKELNIKQYKYSPQIYQKDANTLIKEIETDVLYIDPPYNSRQYINFYHVLENLAEWQKPKVFGKTLKMERENKKSSYSTAKAKSVLKDLVSNAKTNYIVLSYNNTYKANSIASINKISEQDILEILENIGYVKQFKMDYRYFNAGKTNFNNHQEILYLCKLHI